MTFSRMLHLRQVQNVTIKGKGIIDSEGSFIRNMHNIVPNILRTTESKNIEISEVMLRNSAAWTLHLLASQNIKISNLKIINDRSTLNTDGIDPDMTSDVEIENSFIYTKDDAICIKATRNSELSGNSNNILVQNNVVSSVDAALKLGTESDAQLFSNISFKNNAVFDSNRALSVVVRDGALYDSIEFDGVEVGENVTHLIEQVIGRREPAEVKGNIRNLVFKNISAPFYQKPTNNWTWYAQFRGSNPQPWVDVNVFEGNDSLNKVDGLSFSNVVVRGIRLGSRQQAEAVAGLSFGPFVENLSFEPAP
jgi:polygalacturonase